MLTRLLKIRVQITWNWELRVLLNGLGQIQRMGLFILKLARHGQCGNPSGPAHLTWCDSGEVKQPLSCLLSTELVRLRFLGSLQHPTQFLQGLNVRACHVTDCNRS